ncbi:MAG: gephyrin-like molybdotransferase Glp [Chloroflexota bacterium]
MRQSPYPMISVQEALDIIFEQVKPLSPTTKPFTELMGLVLAEDIYATEPMPPFPAATVDGYAVIAADEGKRQVLGDQMAGYVADMTIQPGMAARVTTGAPIPPGADAMVMIEDTDEENGQLIMHTTVSAGNCIRPVGVDIEVGQLVLPAGTVLKPAEVGLLAMIGRTEASVYPTPRIGVMSTGDEIVEPGEDCGPGQIRDANRFTLMNAVIQAGGIPIDLGIVRDQEANLADTFNQGLETADAILTSGGVSMGQLDLVKPYLAEHGTLHFGRVNTKPGKPVTFGLLGGKPFFAMPGFPVSALVSFEVFVRSALLRMAGHTQIHRPRRQVVLAHDVSHGPERTEFQRVILSQESDGTIKAESTGVQASSRLLSMRDANGLIILPHGQGDFPAGSTVEALILDVIP